MIEAIELAESDIESYQSLGNVTKTNQAMLKLGDLYSDLAIHTKEKNIASRNWKKTLNRYEVALQSMIERKEFILAGDAIFTYIELVNTCVEKMPKENRIIYYKRGIATLDDYLENVERDSNYLRWHEIKYSRLLFINNIKINSDNDDELEKLFELNRLIEGTRELIRENEEGRGDYWSERLNSALIYSLIDYASHVGDRKRNSLGSSLAERFGVSSNYDSYFDVQDKISVYNEVLELAPESLEYMRLNGNANDFAKLEVWIATAKVEYGKLRNERKMVIEGLHTLLEYLRNEDVKIGDLTVIILHLELGAAYHFLGDEKKADHFNREGLRLSKESEEG